jgi:uncharacterized RmlC-like cupin family protein
MPDHIRRIRPPGESGFKQELPYFVGISGATAGATAISLNLVVVPPGGAARPHTHVGYETAIYVVSGRVLTRYGPGLREAVESEAGDFLFIPPDLPHQPINLSDAEPAMAVVARNDPNEQESVVPYDAPDEAADRPA